MSQELWFSEFDLTHCVKPQAHSRFSASPHRAGKFWYPISGRIFTIFRLPVLEPRKCEALCIHSWAHENTDRSSPGLSHPPSLLGSTMLQPGTHKPFLSMWPWEVREYPKVIVVECDAGKLILKLFLAFLPSSCLYRQVWNYSGISSSLSLL